MTLSISASLSTSQLRSIRRLQTKKARDGERKFVAEGPQAVREALGYGDVDLLVVADGTDADEFVRLAQVNDVPVVAASADEVSQLSTTVTPQGVLAVCRQPESTDIPDDASLIAVCAHVRDPGNAGTVIRCADAFGADAVIVSEASVDVYNAKTVRASVGSVFHLPVVTDADLSVTLPALRARGFTVYAASAGATTVTDLPADVDKVAWVFGNEAWGLPDDVVALCDDLVAVPMWGKAESLNLASAAAVCLFVTASRRRGAFGA